MFLYCPYDTLICDQPWHIRLESLQPCLGKRQREPGPYRDPPATSFLCTRHGPEGCYVCLLGNLSPFTLDLRRERDTSEPDFRIRSGHEIQSGAGLHPRGPAVRSSQSLSGFGKLQPDGGRGKKAEAALVPKAGQATPEGSRGAQRGRGI